MEECASGMGQRSNYAAVSGAQIMLRKEDCASDMGQRSNYAAAKDAQMLINVDECASGMGQPGLRRNVTGTGAQIML
jgi:hypothetical protein